MTDHNPAHETRLHAHPGLISSSRVTGTDVYNRNAEKLGTVQSMMIDKLSGEVRFVAISFGGFLGIGERFHLLPWHGLTYDTHNQGYVISIGVDALKDAPSYSQDEIDAFDYEQRSASIDDYYGRIDGFYSPHWQAMRSAGTMPS